MYMKLHRTLKGIKLLHTPALYFCDQRSPYFHKLDENFRIGNSKATFEHRKGDFGVGCILKP